MADAITFEQTKKLSIAIQDTLRITKKRKPPKYIDIRNNLDSVSSAAGHVIFGRRGTGKSALMMAAQARLEKKSLGVFIDCEDLKDRQYPDVIIEILISISQQVRCSLSWREVLVNLPTYVRLCSLIKQLKILKKKPLESDREVAEEFSENAKASAHGVSAGASHRVTIQEKKRFVKLEVIRRDLAEWRDLLDKIREAIGKEVIMIFVDDFYQLPVDHQAHIVDIIHRLCKQSCLSFKISTIRHRSQLYREDEGKPVGVQAVHDYQNLDLDFSLERFSETSDALWQILMGISSTVPMSEAAVKRLFRGQGFDRLVTASGGVPRDFLSILANYLNNLTGTSMDPLGKDAVRELSGNYFQSKRSDMNTDAESGEAERLMSLFERINEFCHKRGKNTFMIDCNLASTDPHGLQSILRLADFRLIHKISSSRSNPGHPGAVFDTYMLDIGAYAHMRKLTGRLSEIDLTRKGKTLIDELRTAPVFTLQSFHGEDSSSTNTPKPVEAGK